MTGYLTTHVLDTARGVPARSLKVELYRIEGNIRTHLNTLVTNADGRTNEHILSSDRCETGTYELVFHAGEYLRMVGSALEEPLFLDIIPIRFGMTADSHYHVPRRGA